MSSCGFRGICQCGRPCCAIAEWWAGFLRIWRVVGRTEIRRARDEDAAEIDFASELGAL
jgi:hypothetical protein